jgi:hypothetical protein
VLEVADVFRAAGPAYRAARAGHLSLHQRKVMAAIECGPPRWAGTSRPATAAGTRASPTTLGPQPALPEVPGCGGPHVAGRTWLAAREADLLPVGYFHVVFTLPAEVAQIAFQNKAAVYDLLFRAASETMLTIAADPKHLGARIGLTAVLHTWGSAMTHHDAPPARPIVPGGGLARDGTRWISAKPGFLLPVRVLATLFRRLFLAGLIALHAAGRLAAFGSLLSTSAAPSCATSRRSEPSAGLSMPSRRSPAPRRYSPICRATPTGSPSRTGGASASTRPASPSGSRIIAATGRSATAS